MLYATNIHITWMDMVYGNVGHGATWKQCCRIVGTIPIRCYDDQRALFYRRKHAKEEKFSEYYDVYRVGSRIEHPVYGVGVIKEIIGESVRRIIMDFHDVGLKTLGLAWVHEKCRRC